MINPILNSDFAAEDTHETQRYGHLMEQHTDKYYFDKCPFRCDGVAICDTWENRAKRIEYFMRCQKCGALGPAVDTQERAHEIWGAVTRAAHVLRSG